MLQSVAQHNASKLACNWPASLAFTTILAQHNTSLQLACHSRIYLDSCSVYKVLAEAEVNLRNANLEHISSTVAHFTIREEGAGDIDESKGTYKAGGPLYGVIQLPARTGFSLQQADEACAFVHIEKPRAQQSCPTQDSRNHNLVSMWVQKRTCRPRSSQSPCSPHCFRTRWAD